MFSFGNGNPSNHGRAKSPATDSEASQNYYETLGLQRNATEQEIKDAYRKLALIYHPDRNPGNLDAHESFKKVATAYSVLSDPNKKRQFDTLGPAVVSNNFGDLDLAHAGRFGRFCFMICDKVGLPIQTAITPEVLVKGEELCAGNERSMEVRYLQPQKPLVGCVGRQKAHFFCFTMVEEIASAGVIIHCKSSSVDRFKLVLFDKEGSIRNIGESDAKKNHSVAELFFVPFQKISVKKLSVIAAIMGDRKVPYEFHSLDTLEVQGAHKLESGEHILCVYGDNFFQSVKYELNLLPLNGSCSTNISQISHIEQQLINKKKALGEFQKEYMGVKIAYETELLKGRKQRDKEMFDVLKIDYSAANERLRAENRCLTGLLKEREEHYAKLIDNCRSPDNRVDSLNRRKKSLSSLFLTCL